jgi:hypothetical protein
MRIVLLTTYYSEGVRVCVSAVRVPHSCNMGKGGKGNWETRAEQGRIKREEARERKKNRNVAKSAISLESIVNRLLTHVYTSMNNSNSNSAETAGTIGCGQRVLAWLKDDITLQKRRPNSHEAAHEDDNHSSDLSDSDSEEHRQEPEEEEEDTQQEPLMVCKEWFRSDSCASKKCKYIHAGLPVFELGNIEQQLADNNSKKTECGCRLKTPLETLRPSNYPSILFISVNGRCVYDYSNPHTWEAYWEEATQTSEPRRRRGTESSLEDGDSSQQGVATAAGAAIDTVESVKQERPNSPRVSWATPECVVGPHPSSRRLLGVGPNDLSAQKPILNTILGYLDFDDMRAIMICARYGTVYNEFCCCCHCLHITRCSCVVVAQLVKCQSMSTSHI